MNNCLDMRIALNLAINKALSEKTNLIEMPIAVAFNIDDLLKEWEAVEKNKECHEDKTVVECLNAIQTINKYIDEEEEECGCTYWKDKKGYAFHADTGYFFEGLDNFEAYLIKRLRKAVNEK